MNIVRVREFRFQISRNCSHRIKGILKLRALSIRITQRACIEMKKLSFCLLPVFLVMHGCSSDLSVSGSGSNVRVVDDASKYDCTFVNTLSDCETFSPTITAEQRSAVYELRDQASKINANALAISNMVTNLGGSTATGRAYSCRFNDKKRQEPSGSAHRSIILSAICVS